MKKFALFAMAALLFAALPAFALAENAGRTAQYANGTITTEAVAPAPTARLGAAIREAGDIRANAAAERNGIRNETRAENAAIRADATVQREDVRTNANGTRVGPQIAQINAEARVQVRTNLIEEQAALRQTRVEAREQVRETVISARANWTGLNTTQKVVAKIAVYKFVNATIDSRLDVASRLETRGADAELVANFTGFAQAQKERIAEAKNASQKRALVAQLNLQWNEFRRENAKSVIAERLSNATQIARNALTKIDGVIAALKANGTDTQTLEAISARVELRIEAASASNITLRQMAWRIGYAKRGLQFLYVQVKRAVAGQVPEDMTDEAEPAGLLEPDTASVQVSADAPTIVGNDRDEHGCIGSAGYTWCEAKQKCLRTWEEAC